MSNIRFGLIGAGAISHFAAKAIQSHPDAVIVAAHDPHAARLEDLCSKFGIARSHAMVEDLLGDDEVDAVYIAVPNKFHAPLALQALAADKHVILDKPFAMNLAEAQTVAHTAAASRRLFMLGMNQRFREPSQKIKTIVKQGMLGEIYHAKAYWFRRAGIPAMGTWFSSKAMAGGGALLDIGVHLLDLCLYTIDNFDPVSVTGATYTKFGNRGLHAGTWGKSDPDSTIKFDVDDFASALIKFSNGATVTLDVSWACHAAEPGRMNVDLYGTDAGASIFPPKLYRPNAATHEYEVTDVVDAPPTYPHCERFHNFINAILGREEPCCTIEQALTVQQILDAIYESCRTGSEVKLARLAPTCA